MPMIGGGDCVGGCIVKMMAGMSVANNPAFIRFPPNPRLKIQTMASQCQPDKHQVEINAVVFNQGVQSVEKGIEHRSRI